MVHKYFRRDRHPYRYHTQRNNQRNNQKAQPATEKIPAPKPIQNNYQTPQNMNKRNPVNMNTAPPKFTQRAPPLQSPYEPPSNSKLKSNSGNSLFGVAASLISGSSEMESLLCEYCGEDNGEQPKNEIKQFQCVKCKIIKIKKLASYVIPSPLNVIKYSKD